MVTQVALFNYRSHKTKPKFMNLEKGLEVISDVGRARMEVKMRGQQSEYVCVLSSKQSTSPSVNLVVHVQVDYILGCSHCC